MGQRDTLFAIGMKAHYQRIPTAAREVQQTHVPRMHDVKVAAHKDKPL
jgi:hypothetical protein